MRIIFSAHLSIPKLPTGFPEALEAGRRPRWPAAWSISPWERIPAVLSGSLQATAALGVSTLARLIFSGWGHTFRSHFRHGRRPYPMWTRVGARGDRLAGLREASAQQPGTIHLIREAFDLADAKVRQALIEPVRRLRDRFGERVRESSLGDLADDELGKASRRGMTPFVCFNGRRSRSCLGSWIADAEPELRPGTAANFELTKQLDRRRIAEAVERRERYYRRLHSFLGPHDLLCIPTTPALAPRKGDSPLRASSANGYYPRALALTSLSGIGRLPQVSLPVASSKGLPVGLSLLARYGQDALLLEVARNFS